MKLLWGLATILLISWAHGNPATYERYQVVEFKGLPDFKSHDDLFKYLKITEEDPDIELWQEFKDSGTAQIYMSEPKKNEILQSLDKTIQHSIVIEDIDELLVTNDILRSGAPINLKGNLTLERYMSYDEITEYLTKLAEENPSKVRLGVAGYSYENKTIHQVTITDRLASSYNKPVIFVEAGIHAREFISPASTLNLIQRLVDSKTETSDIEWIILPLTNPDGYSYAYKNQRNRRKRFWRKNRRDKNTSCPGVDLNRNFDASWSNTHGSSKRKCSEVYKGTAPFSEPETQAIRDSALLVKDRIQAYMGVHSYSQLLLYPPSVKDFCINEIPLAATSALAEKMVKNLPVQFKPGNTVTLLYQASGGSMDWAYETLKSHRSYVIELRDTGRYGFLLPDRLIAETVDDLWIAMTVLSDDVRNNPPAEPFNIAC